MKMNKSIKYGFPRFVTYIATNTKRATINVSPTILYHKRRRTVKSKNNTSFLFQTDLEKIFMKPGAGKNVTALSGLEAVISTKFHNSRPMHAGV